MMNRDWREGGEVEKKKHIGIHTPFFFSGPVEVNWDLSHIGCTVC